jgi:hypothetical protein
MFPANPLLLAKVVVKEASEADCAKAVLPFKLAVNKTSVPRMDAGHDFFMGNSFNSEPKLNFTIKLVAFRNGQIMTEARQEVDCGQQKDVFFKGQQNNSMCCCVTPLETL